MKIKLFLLVAVIFSISCSRLPKENVPQAKLNADQTLLLAQKNEHHYKNAKLLYENAYRQYRLLADSDGQLQTLSGLARISLQEKDSLSYQNYQQKMKNVINYIAPSKVYYLELLNLYNLHANKKWQEISAMVNIDENYPKTVKIQLFSYKIQADTYLQQVHTNELKQLIKLQKFYSKRIHSRQESFPQLASNASYSLAFYYFTNRDYRKAHTFILQAKEIDYQFELLQNYAFDLWLEAQIRLAQEDIAKAIALFNQAKVIFIEFNNTSMETKINKILRKYSL